MNFFKNTTDTQEDNSSKDQNLNSETKNTETNTKDYSDQMNVDSNKINEIKEEPKVTETEIANFTSTLYDKDENRVFNIGLAISKLNGKIVKKDEEFSFNNTIGPMDEAHGYKEAVGFDTNGKKIKVSGGGMCQISSTLYNSVLIAGLQVTERHPHSRRVYYVPKDKDATIFYGSLDFKFINNSRSRYKNRCF